MCADQLINIPILSYPIQFVLVTVLLSLVKGYFEGIHIGE